MTLKEKLVYLLALSLEYGINPRAFMWKKVMGRSSDTYYVYLSDLRKRPVFDQAKLDSVRQDFRAVLRNAVRVWKSRWKGSWYLVIFDIPEKQRLFRDKLRRKLMQFGFGQLQESIMICPVDRFHLIQKSVFYEELKPYLLYLQIRKVYGLNPSQLISSCWNLGEMRKQYEKFLEVYERRVGNFLSSVGTLSREEDEVSRRWLLMMIQSEFAELLKRFPPLPRGFAAGKIPFDKLVEMYRVWRRKLR